MAVKRINRADEIHVINDIGLTMAQAENSGIPTSPDNKSDTASETRRMLLRVRNVSFQHIKAITTLLEAMMSAQNAINGPCIIHENLLSHMDL